MADSTCNDEEPSMTVQEAAQELAAHEEEVIAVLGAGDADNCTYSLGYVDRQPLFSCFTCDPQHLNPAGICLACSVKCHSDHDLIELYTKRDFRCDCGNSKFNGFKCSLQKEKDLLNEKNKYNQNFSGHYCKCKRPYPDPEDEIEDEMIQCIICEDWYHTRHLQDLPPDNFLEMACHPCAKEHPFLHYYNHLTVCAPTVVTSTTNNEDIDVTSTTPGCGANSLQTTMLNEQVTSQRATENVLSENNPSSSTYEPSSSSGSVESDQGCRLDSLKSKSKEEGAAACLYWSEGWRNQLCHCTKCLALYEKQSIAFIVKESDTLAFYESKGKENVKKVWENAANSIAQMNRVQQIELVNGYNELKSGLHDFFSNFDKNEVVKKEDIENFFEQLNQRKRRRLDGVPPPNCR